MQNFKEFNFKKKIVKGELGWDVSYLPFLCYKHIIVNSLNIENIFFFIIQNFHQFNGEKNVNVKNEFDLNVRVIPLVP